MLFIFIIIIIVIFSLAAFRNQSKPTRSTTVTQNQSRPTMSTTVIQVTPFSVLATVPPPSGITRVYRSVLFNKTGVLSPNLLSQASEFVSANSNATYAATRTLEEFFNATLLDRYNNDTEKMATAKAWLLIDIGKSSPRYLWHRDGQSGLAGPGQVPSSYAMTLVGPPTVILCPSPEVDAAMPGFEESSAHMLSYQPREGLRTGQIYRFTSGSVDSPVHSTPIFNEDRIFLTVEYY